MAFQTITSQLPEHIYKHIQWLAKTTEQPLEVVFLHGMENAFLPPKPEEENAELCFPNYLSDDALGHHPPPNAPFPQEWMQVLIADTIKDTLWEAEHKQLRQPADLGKDLCSEKAKQPLVIYL